MEVARPSRRAFTPGGRLLVFTLGPRAETRRRRLLPVCLQGPEVGLHQACLDALVAAARSTGLQVEVCSPTPLPAGDTTLWRRQEGQTFGERLRAALRCAFEAGPGPLIVVGTDTPELGPAQLADTLARLDENPERVIVGPSRDGGVYLIAAVHPLDAVLEGVHWCGPHTRRSLLEALSRAGRPVVLLGPLADLDRPADLGRWLAYPTGACGALRTWADRLRSVLAERRRPLMGASSSAGDAPQTRRQRGRAPPAFPLPLTV